MSTFLHSLYKEYQDLSSKINSISDLIYKYGGEIPQQEMDIDSLPQDSMEIPEDVIVGNNPKLPQQSLQSSTEGISAVVDHSIQLSQQVQHPTGIVSDNSKNLTQSPLAKSIVQTGFEYPKQGKWKDKIIYALRIGGKPSVAKDIATFIQGFEPSENAAHVLSMIRQYTCNLAKHGHIGVDNTEHANKYFLLT